MDALIVFGAEYLYLAVIAVAGAFYFLQKRESQKKILILAAIALPLAYLIAKIGGALYFDPRPFVVGNFTPLFPHVPDNGFPSDHALLTAAISSVIYFSNRTVSGVLWLLTLAVGAARVAAGVHHSVDIAGSIIIAAAVVYAVHLILKRQIRWYL